MDLRDIQRLHAQFAPDAMTIDLPRQIAALPSPVAVSADDKAPTIKLRLPQAAPAVRRSVVALAIAAVMGMAGMGAASLFKSFGTTSAHQSRSPTVTRGQSDPVKAETLAQPAGASANRPIDAEPPHPVAMTPVLTGKDIAALAPVGLTADQFKSSLSNTGGSATSAAIAKPSAALANDDQRAAASPIHQSRRDAAAEHVDSLNKSATSSIATPSATPAPAAVPVQSVPQTSADDHPSSFSTAQPRSHSYRRYVSRPRDDVSDGDAATASAKKSTPASRASTNEVQMF
jgi:hypothetical protein